MQKCLTKHRMGSIIYYDYDTVFCESSGENTISCGNRNKKELSYQNA